MTGQTFVKWCFCIVDLIFAGLIVYGLSQKMFRDRSLVLIIILLCALLGSALLIVV